VAPLEYATLCQAELGALEIDPSLARLAFCNLTKIRSPSEIFTSPGNISEGSIKQYIKAAWG